MTGQVTRRGRAMRPALRRALVTALADPASDNVAQKVLAKRLGVAVRTLRDYMTVEVLAEVEMLRRSRVSVDELVEVDRAMLRRAREGHVAAAKLIYARLAGMALEEEAPMTLEEIEREVQRLRRTTNT